ncbi:MAG: DUF2752 domain-containing protein [Bacteroidia bacterium]
MLTGFPCPGCGITKSMVCFLRGEFIASLKYHLFGPFAILTSLMLVICLPMFKWTIPGPMAKMMSNVRFAYGIAMILSLYHGLRIIDFIQTKNINQIIQESIWI